MRAILSRPPMISWPQTWLVRIVLRLAFGTDEVPLSILENDHRIEAGCAERRNHTGEQADDQEER
jgi:hypothetical protein